MIKNTFVEEYETSRMMVDNYSDFLSFFVVKVM